MSQPLYQFQRDARRLPTALVVAGVWAVLAAAWFFLGAAWWIIGVLALFTLPALYDLAANPSAGLVLERQRLHWHSGKRHASLGLNEIAHMRLDTRLDFSVRATAVLHTGRKIRLPFESTPPHQALETALQDAGLKVERHHFTLMQ